MTKKITTKRRTETDVLRECKKIFEMAGWLVDRNHQVPVRGRKLPKEEEGRSDLSCTKPPDGQTVAVEIKVTQEEYEKWLKQDNPAVKSHRRAISQKQYGNRVRKACGLFYCIYSPEQAQQIVRDLSRTSR